MRTAVPQAAPNFEVLYVQYFPFVRRTARRLGVPEGCLEDVCQDVFFALHRRLPDFAGRSSLRTWVFGFTLNVVQVHHRSQRRKNVAFRAVGELLDPDTLFDDSFAADERLSRAEVMRCACQSLAEIPAENRDVFVMASIEGMSAVEISREFQLNVNTVYTRLRSARQQFKRLVRRHPECREGP
ncbi:MAG TPA: RNA polymerase sigma factor [Polyangiaceae bacterium]|nr:RNA polymerase sigma factor [Polyangiaceae bacterium]